MKTKILTGLTVGLMNVALCGSASAVAMLCFLFLATPNPALANILLAHDSSIVGNGTLAQDGYNLTRDTDTGLEWLR